MRINHQDKKEGLIKLTVENLEDLWHLERVLSEGDKVQAISYRSFKANEKSASEKKKINVLIVAKKIEFAKSSNRLRITGPIESGTPLEYVQVGSFHTIDIEPQTTVSIYKDWKNHHLSRLKKAIEQTKRPRLHILVLDEKKAIFASVLGFGINYDWELENTLSKRDDSKKQSEAQSQYFGNILSRISEFSQNKIIVAGSGFAPSNFAQFVKEKNQKLASNFVMAHCSYAERSGVNELMKNGVVSKVASDERIAIEMQLMDEFKVALAKSSKKIVYGIKNVSNALEHSAVSKILVLDEVLRNNKQVDKLIEDAENAKVEIMIFSHESDSGAELAGFGGLIAFLRFELRDE